MFIKGITLENFQKHEAFETNFIEGVNVIHGETDAGKSCIIRAIRWVMFNEPKGEVVRKTGSSRTSVTLALDSGVVIKRIKSDSENAYEVTSDGSVKRYDSIGKDIPDDIQKLFGVSTMEVDKESLNLNIAPQMALPFLLKDSGTFRMKVFNKLTGNDIIDMVLQSFNKDLLSIGRDVRALTEEIQMDEDALTGCKLKRNKLHKRYELVKTKYEALKERAEKILALKSLLRNRADSETSLRTARNLVDKIRIPDDEVVKTLRGKSERMDKVTGLIVNRWQVDGSISGTKKSFKEIVLPDAKVVETLKLRVDALKNLVRMTVERRTVVETYENTTPKMNILDEEIKALISEYKGKLKELKVCPLCKGEITEACLDKIVL